MHELLDSPSELIPLVAIVGGLTFAATIVIINTTAAVLKTKAKEQSRREIAAYVAEGSMTPDEGERLMKAGDSADA